MTVSVAAACIMRESMSAEFICVHILYPLKDVGVTEASASAVSHHLYNENCGVTSAAAAQQLPVSRIFLYFMLSGFDEDARSPPQPSRWRVGPPYPYGSIPFTLGSYHLAPPFACARLGAGRPDYWKEECSGDQMMTKGCLWPAQAT